MELLVLFIPLLFGPLVLAVGLVQLVLARLQPIEAEALPLARVHTGRPLEDLDSLGARGRRNLVRGALLCAGLLLVYMSLVEAAT